MSWDGYITNICSGKAAGIITKATIVGKNGAIWTPPGTLAEIMNITQAEATLIGTGMAQGASKDWTSGVNIGGVKYMYLRDMDGDGRIIQFKKTKEGALIFVGTKQAVIIAFVPEDKSSSVGDASVAVDAVGKWLEDSGY